MNAQRRKVRDEILERLDGIVADLEELRNEEEEALENMPENLQESERAIQMQDNIDRLDEIINEIDNQKCELEDVD